MNNSQQLASITEVLPPVPYRPPAPSPVPHSSHPGAIVQGEDGQLYRLQPLSQTTAGGLSGFWVGLAFIGSIGAILVLIQALKPEPQPAPVIVQPPQHITTNPNCIFWCR